MPRQSARERFEFISTAAREDPNIVGFVVTGSRGKGLITKESDYDIFVVVDDAKAVEYQFKYRKLEGEGLDLGIMGLEEFRGYAAWGSSFAWDRYDFAHNKAVVDKLNGEIQKIIDEKGKLPDEHREGLIMQSCDHFINQFYRAWKCQHRQESGAAKLELAEGVSPLLDVMFGLHGRLRPFYKYLEWELLNYPLILFSWDPAKLYSLILNLSARVDETVMKEVFTETERVSRAHGFGGVFDSWGEDHLVLLRK